MRTDWDLHMPYWTKALLDLTLILDSLNAVQYMKRLSIELRLSTARVKQLELAGSQKNKPLF